MGDFLRILAYQGSLDFIVLRNRSLSGLGLRRLFVCLNCGNRSVVIVLGSLLFGIREDVLGFHLRCRALLGRLLGVRMCRGRFISLRATQEECKRNCQECQYEHTEQERKRQRSVSAASRMKPTSAAAVRIIGHS